MSRKKIISKGKGEKKNEHPILYSSKSAKDLGLTNWWSVKNFNADKKYGITGSIKDFFDNEGFDEYAYARSNGYGVKGALTTFLLSYVESNATLPEAYKEQAAINNFFGVKPGPHNFKEYPTIEAGEEAGVNLFESSNDYKALRPLLREDNPSIDSLDVGLKKYDPGHPKYATHLHDDIMEGFMQRALTENAIEIANLKSQVDAYKSNSPLNLDYLSKAAPFLLSDKNKLDLHAIDDMQTKITTLQHIQKELTTGLPDKDANWPPPMKPSPPPQPEQWHPPMTMPINQQDTIPFGPYKLPFETGSVEGDNPTQGYGMTGSSDMQSGGSIGMAPSPAPASGSVAGKASPPAFSITNIPSAGSIAPAAPAANGGSSSNGGISFNFENLGTHKNTHSAAGSQPDNMHAQLLAVLSSAVADSKVSGDVC